MISCFEHLCNELLLSLFEYINPRDLNDTFGNLNIRFNNLLASITDLQLIVDGEENREIIDALAPHTGLLQVNTWDEIDLHGFHNLHSLILSRPSAEQLKQIRSDTMPKLIHLSLFSNVYFSAPRQLIDDAFSNRFSFLRWARLGHIDLSDPRYRGTQSYSLHHLHISCSHTSMIPFVLASCPNLEYLHVDILRYDEKIIISSPIIRVHPLQQFVLQNYCHSMSHEDIQSLLTYIPNTRKIELKFDCNTSFVSLAQCLSDSLSYLCRFDCDIIESLTESSVGLRAIQQIHPCFSRILYRTRAKNFRIFATRC